MDRNSLLKRAFLDALGVVAYVLFFSWLIGNFKQWFGGDPGGWLGPVLFLLMFIISASVTGSLVLLKPVLLYAEGQKKEAVNLFVYTIGFLVFIALVVGFYIGSTGTVSLP